MSDSPDPAQVPCIAVVENMAYFDGAGQRFFPFGEGSGARICSEFGLPNLTRMPIIPELSAAGDGVAPQPNSEQGVPDLQQLRGFSEVYGCQVAHPQSVYAAGHLMQHVLCGCLQCRIRLQNGARLDGLVAASPVLVGVRLPAGRQQCSAPG